MRGLVDAIARTDRRAFAILFLVAFGIRSAVLLRAGDWILLEPGLELERIARSIAETGRFADPYAVPTGATAHLPPLYAGFVGGLWLFFGDNVATGHVRCLLGIAAFSAMLGLLPWLARRLGLGRHAGVVGGLVGALTPRSTEETGAAWEEPYAALALGLLLVAFLAQWTAPRVRPWRAFLFGVVIGVVLHLAPNLASVVAGCAGFGLCWRRSRGQLVATAVMALGVTLAFVPWSLRNQNELGGVVFVRSNFGLELRMGNHEGADPDLEVTAEREGNAVLHPAANVAEAHLVREVGELEYVRRARNEAVSWIVEHPGQFVRLTAGRVLRFWCGPLRQGWLLTALISGLTALAVIGAALNWSRMTIPERAAVFLPLLLFPLVYYVVGYMDRYRNPVHWMVLMLAGAALWRRPSARLVRQQ